MVTLMDSQFDNVKIDEPNSIPIHKSSTSFKIILFFLAVTLFPCSSRRIPAAVKFIGDNLRWLYLYLLNPRVIFIFGNAIVMALFLLSRQHDAGDNSGSVPHREIVNVSDKDATKGTEERTEFEVDMGKDDPPEETEQLKKNEEEELKKKCEIAEESPVDLRRSETERQIMLFNSEIEKAKKLIERFQRSHSEKLKREISIRPNRELRLPETEKTPVLFNSDEGWRRMPVDKLSNEEFRLTVEAFIKKQQRFLKAQEIE